MASEDRDDTSSSTADGPPVSAQEAADALLSVRNLEKHYPVTEGLLRRVTGRVRAVDGVSFDLRRGETLGLVGESGCGKTTVARTLLALDAPTGGTIEFDGEDVTDLSGRARKRFRRRVQIVFQDPTSSFDPRMSIGDAVAEPMTAHGLTDADRRGQRVTRLLELVGLSASVADQYPHELSGGQKQRAALARALSLGPDVLVLDEPVSALDVSVQAEILGLIDDLQREFDLSILLISHDMSVVRQLCDRVGVMYLGELVERGPTSALFDRPAHPYTRALLAAVPRPDPHDRIEDASLAGDVPDPASPPSGCRFHTRCPSVIPPDDRGVSESVWRRGFELRIDLRNRSVSVEALREQAAGRGGFDDPADVPESELRTAIRSEYDLPSSLDDTEAERAVSEAIGTAIDGDQTTAATHLADAFTSVCERVHPALQERDGHAVACQLYAGSADGS